MDKKKVLIVTYYWPPAGGPGVQRWLKFAKYLPEFGFQPIIYTPENPSYPLVDQSLKKEVPAGIPIVKTKIIEPYALAERLSKGNKKFKAGQFDLKQNQSFLAKLSIWVRGNFFIPDARKFWIRPSVKFLKTYLQEQGIDTVITTGPPHSMHLIGLKLKEQNPQLKWVADFRDPWTEISYYRHLKLSKRSDKKHRDLEKQVLQSADLILATSFSDAENFKALGANAQCITNGFDPSDTCASPETPIELPQQFTIAYMGVLEQLRNPALLWEILSELLEEIPELKEDLILEFIGRIDPKILSSLNSGPLKAHVIEKGYLPHQEALAQMQKAALLLITNFDSSSSKGIIPGKLFEYLASEKAILSFGPKEADVARILEQTGSGSHFGYTEHLKLKAFLKEKYAEFKSEAHFKPSGSIEPYARPALTQTLAKALNEL